MSRHTAEKPGLLFLREIFDLEYQHVFRENLDRYLTYETPTKDEVHDLLRQYCQNLDINRYRVAVLLSLLNEPVSDPQIRQALDLGEPAATYSEEPIAPILNYPDNVKSTYICTDTEIYFQRAFDKTWPYFRLHQFAPHLLGKEEGAIVVIATKNFETGAGDIFIKGVWYFLKQRQLVKQILTARHKEYHAMYGHHFSLLMEKARYAMLSKIKFTIEDNVVIWSEPVGVWQPVRGLAPENSEVAMQYYDDQIFEDFLLQKIRYETLYSMHGLDVPSLKW